MSESSYGAVRGRLADTELALFPCDINFALLDRGCVRTVDPDPFILDDDEFVPSSITGAPFPTTTLDGSLDNGCLTVPEAPFVVAVPFEYSGFDDAAGGVLV